MTTSQGLKAIEQGRRDGKLKREFHRRVAETQSGVDALLKQFDAALMVKPFLWFELGYTRPTDWMVHIWDRTGGEDKKIIETQGGTCDATCYEAATLLRKYLQPKTQGAK